jgi:signal peptidase I
LGLSLAGKDAVKYADLRIRSLAYPGSVRWLTLALRRALIYGSAAVLAIVISGGIFFFTPLIGFSIAHTQGTSMEPGHKQGDLVLVRKIDGTQAKAGDVIVFKEGDIRIMHRVLQTFTNSSGEAMLVTQGDNVPVPDHPIQASQVTSRLVTKVPLLGDASRLLHGAGGFHVYRSIVITIAVFWVALWGLAASAKQERAPEDSPTV